MVTVRATCSTCGDVEVTIADVQIQVCVSTSEATYSLICPTCHLIVNKEANDRVLEVLSDAGARLVVWNLPAELDEVKNGPVITHNDLLAFHMALQDDDWAGQLFAPPGQTEQSGLTDR